jgi:hypothetical protein
VNASSETIKLGREGLTRVEFAGPLGFGGSHLLTGADYYAPSVAATRIHPNAASGIPHVLLDGDLVVPHINKSGLT